MGETNQTTGVSLLEKFLGDRRSKRGYYVPGDLEIGRSRH